MAQLPPSEDERYIVRDTELKGFFLVVGKRRKTFTVQGDLRAGGTRKGTVRLALGLAGQMTTRAARAEAKMKLAQISRGEHPGAELETSGATAGGGDGVTLGQAWERYQLAMTRKGRSNRTIASYEDHVSRLLADWCDRPVAELGARPALVAERHDLITRRHGPYIANGTMRTFRAIYNHARRTHRELPPGNPADGVDWNQERRRNSAMGLNDLPLWFAELAVLGNPVRREFHLLTLLSGCRPAALRAARLADLDLRRRVLHIPRPKGGADRAFDIPLSRQMIASLVRAMRFGRTIYPAAAQIWLFPADSEDGHLTEHKEDRSRLSKWGNDLRQTYRTLAAPAGVSALDAHLLMNHAAAGVNAGYITRGKLLDDHLRDRQQAISDLIFRAALAAENAGGLTDWLGPGAARRKIRASWKEGQPERA